MNESLLFPIKVLDRIKVNDHLLCQHIWQERALFVCVCVCECKSCSFCLLFYVWFHILSSATLADKLTDWLTTINWVLKVGAITCQATSTKRHDWNRPKVIWSIYVSSSSSSLTGLKICKYFFNSFFQSQMQFGNINVFPPCRRKTTNILPSNM